MAQQWIPDFLPYFPSVQRLQSDERAVVMPGLGSKYVERVEIRPNWALSRGEYAQIVNESLDTEWIVESVRWRWAEQDLYVSYMTLVHHLTP